MMRPTIEIAETPDEADYDVIVAGLAAHASEAIGPAVWETFSIRLRDPDGKAIGGLWGRFALDWLFVQLLFVPQQFRGQGIGSEIMLAAETRALEKNCVGVWLDTFEFQALSFYTKRGYSVFGQIEDHPRGSRRYFLQKRLDG